MQVLYFDIVLVLMIFTRTGVNQTENTYYARVPYFCPPQRPTDSAQFTLVGPRGEWPSTQQEVQQR
jgi:hypothetical protein